MAAGRVPVLGSSWFHFFIRSRFRTDSLNSSEPLSELTKGTVLICLMICCVVIAAFCIAFHPILTSCWSGWSVELAVGDPSIAHRLRYNKRLFYLATQPMSPQTVHFRQDPIQRCFKH